MGRVRTLDLHCKIVVLTSVTMVNIWDLLTMHANLLPLTDNDFAGFCSLIVDHYRGAYIQVVSMLP